MPAARYLVATARLAPSSGWFGGKYYVDLIQPGVTEKFIEVTFDAYRRDGVLAERTVHGVHPGARVQLPHMTAPICQGMNSLSP